MALARHCAAFDVNLGCSGYVYGLWLASQFVASGSAKRVLLLVGDLATRRASPMDRSVALLFGDAGTATGIERDPNGGSMTFSLGTDGTGENHLIVPAASFRTMRSELPPPIEVDENNIRTDEHVHMNGAEIFTFTLREVQPMVQEVIAARNWTDDDVDSYVMHQANKFMLNHLAKKMKLPKEKVVLALEEFGNTSSASIPLAMTHALRDKLQNGGMNLVLAGFGVGFSWGAVALRAESVVMPEVLLVGDEAIRDRSHLCGVC
jgi:3-oxoacyl-[acyl-carrier-protein] synthase-3